MKNHFIMATVILLFGFCKMFDEISASEKLVSEGMMPGSVESLGKVFTGTNVSWNCNLLRSSIHTERSSHASAEPGYGIAMAGNDLCKNAALKVSQQPIAYNFLGTGRQANAYGGGTEYNFSTKITNDTKHGTHLYCA